jgi:hypothetical protein
MKSAWDVHTPFEPADSLAVSAAISSPAAFLRAGTARDPPSAQRGRAFPVT